MAGIKIRLGDQVFTGTGAGNGGFDAFTTALARILKRQGMTLPPLIDYEIRIPKGGRTDALTECSITWQTERGELRTRGVHANQVFAAIGATMRMLNIQMHRALAESRRE
jgi:D-citramalate synthase